MQRFKSARHVRYFLFIHCDTHNHFQLRRHHLTADQHCAACDATLRTWSEVAGVGAAVQGTDQPQAIGVSSINLTTLLKVIVNVAVGAEEVLGVPG